MEPPETSIELMRPGFVSSPVSAKTEPPTARRPVTADTWPATVNEPPPSLAMTPLLASETPAPKEAAAAPNFTKLKAPAPVLRTWWLPVKLTSAPLAPKRKTAAAAEVLSTRAVPSVMAVKLVMVWVVPLRSTVAISEVRTSGLMMRPALTGREGMASLAEKRNVPRSRSMAAVPDWFQLEAAPLVPSTSVPSPPLSMRTPNAVEVVKLPMMTVSPEPSSVHARLAVNELAKSPPKVTDFPAATLL